MDSRDLIVLGLVGVGGWLAWRWYKRQPVANAQQTAPTSVAGLVSSSMWGDNARSTLFGGNVYTKRVFAPVPLRVPMLKLPAPTAPPSAVLARTALTFPQSLSRALSASFAPEPTTPANSARHFTSTGIIGLQGTQPSGDQPQPGDPSPMFIMGTRGIA